MAYEVKNKVALVTGANRGIGKAIVDALITAGAAKVYAAVRDIATAHPLVEAYGDQVVPIELDLSKPDTVISAAQQADDVTLVVNNAGVLRTATPLDQSAFEALDFEMDVNVKGLMRVAQAFGPVLAKNGGGALVQLNSVASILNFAGFSTYSASKAASYSITQGLRSIWAESGVDVVSVHPGPIATDMADAAGLEGGEAPSVVADSILEALESGTFHAFPDSMAKQIGEAYQGYAGNVIEAETVEG
ncbi:MAG: SDR family oxidoreductase [Planctomycetota bacterium]